MKVYSHKDFYNAYTSDYAAELGRMESIINVISPHVDICSIHLPATKDNLLAVHSPEHIEQIRQIGLYSIAALAAGGAIQAAETGVTKEPAFALIRPPGHHATAIKDQGFCFFNNMAVSLSYLRSIDYIKTAFILDIDYHYGNGNADIFENESWVDIFDPCPYGMHISRQSYLDMIKSALQTVVADVIAVSAGFDRHIQDWGHLLFTKDFYTIGLWVRNAAKRNNGGCYGILEGGYNHNVLGESILAFLNGLR